MPPSAAQAKEVPIWKPGPDRPPGRPVLGAPERLQQVVWNLLSNAIKFTPKGGSVMCLVIDRRSGIGRDHRRR